MPQQRLAESLKQLHDELQSTSTLDEQTRQLLRAVLDDIAGLLRAEPPAQPADESLVGRLADATRDFETSHPRLTHAVAQVTDALAGMGL